MPLVGAWFKAWVYLGLVCGWGKSARPRFDTSTDMGLVLVPADAEVDSVIFRLRATDQDADFPLVFEVTATITPVVRIDNLPCTLYNKVCQANVILTKRLMPGRLHDFAVRVRDTKGDSNSMQATISATNATTSRDKIFPHIPSLIMIPEDAKPGRELDYLLVRANSWSGKPVYIELWQPKELFTIRQRQTPTQTRGVITLIGELDFETQSMYTLTIYATDPYTEPGKDTRNIAGLNIVVIVQDVQDVPPIFTLAPPLTRLNNSVQIGDVILRVHAEDGDKGVPREITYGLVSEGNPFIPFFNISETTGEIVLAKPLDELTQITHVGAPVVLTVVAEEIRRSRDEPPAQATVVDVGFLLGEPGNSPPYFESDNYVTSIRENLEPGSVIMFPEQYSTRVRDEDIGKAGVFTLKLQNNNGTFEISPTVAERTADFILMVRDNELIDYEMHESLSFKIIAQEVGPATNLSASAAVVIFIQDVNDNPPIFDEESYEVTLSENITAGTRVIQVHATDKDTGLFGSIQYTSITGRGSDAFAIDADTGLITVAMGSSLDREMAAQLQLTVNARDENGKGNTGTVPLIVNLLDVNDNAPVFEQNGYEFALNSDLTNFSTPAIIKATDADAESPNNEIRYELIHGNYENKFYLNEITGELTLRSPITKFRRKKQSIYDNFSNKLHKGTQSLQPEHIIQETVRRITVFRDMANSTENVPNEIELKRQVGEIKRHRRKRAEADVLYTLTARAYDLGVPHLASETEISIVRGTAMEARIMMFVVPGDRPNLMKTAETLATITGGRITVLDTRPYVSDNKTGVTNNTVPIAGKRTIVVARVEQTEIGTPLVDVEKIRNTLAANGVGIIGGAGNANGSMTYYPETTPKFSIDGVSHDGGDSTGTYVNKTISNVHEEVTVYKAENKLLFWLLIILGLLMLLAIAALIICCICPGCPFYMAPRKRRVYSSETLVVRSDGRPKRHLYRKPMADIDTITSNGKKQAWSADPTRRNWQFNRRNTKNGGLASLPGDVVYISERPPIDQANVESLRLRDGPAYDPARRRRLEEQERMYMEDVDEKKIRDYDVTDADSLQQHEIERGSDIHRQAYRQRYIDPELNNETTIREQHFYREGNAEVLQLVTRGQVEDRSQHRYPTFIVDGKDVLLQRFMQDQKARHEMPMQETEVVRTIDSHQRSRNLYPHKQEILLLPEELDVGRRRAEESESGAQKLAMDDEYAMQNLDAETQMRDVRRQEISTNLPGMSPKDRSSVVKDQMQSTTMQSYAFHDLELARQNALLTRLLLERESRNVGGIMMDVASYLETQSLPGQVAIATQTDRVAATQTERHVRSRSDNDESDEDTRNRKRMKKRHGESELRTRTLWMKTPIEEEEVPRFDKRLNILRKKVQEVKEGRKVPLEPQVLREISDSLDENGSTYCEKTRKSAKTCQQYTEESSIGYKVLGEGKIGSSSSTEKQHEKSFDEKRAESLSSPEISVDNGKYIRETTEKKSSRKESKIKKQKKVESVIKPSFRVLEREITMLTKKLSKLADKKVQQTTESESTSQEKSRVSKDSKKVSDQSTSKKTEDSKKHKRFETSPSISKETKSEKFKYQQPQIMSPGSSEYDDAFERLDKSKLASRQEATKNKQTSGHTKVKRQTQIERKKQIIQQNRESEKRRNAASKESGRSKMEKTAEKIALRTQKLAAIGRKERVHVSEDPSTSTSSDRMNGKKDSFTSQGFDKKTSESSEVPSNHAYQRKSKQKMDHVSERFSDDFVTESQKRDIEQPSAFYSTIDRNMDKEDTANGERNIEIIQQFSDDFTIEPQTKKLEHQMQAAVETEILSNNRQNAYELDNEPMSLKEAVVVTENEQGTSHDFDKERLTLKETAEDLTVLQNLEDMQHKSEVISNIASKEQVELFKTSDKELEDSSKSTVLSDSPALKALEEHQTEKLQSYSEKSAVEKRIAYMAGKHQEAAEESFDENEKEEVTPEKELHEIQRLKDVEKTASGETSALEKHIDSLTKSIDITEHIEKEKEHENDELHDDIISLQSKVEKDSEDITQSLYSSVGDKIVELHKTESDQREESSPESKKHIEEEISSTKAAIYVEQKMIEELMQKENEEESLNKIENDVEKLKEFITQEFESEKIEESTTEMSEEPFDISRSFTDNTGNLNGSQRAFSIDDDTLLYIDETSDEASKSDHDLIQSELIELPDIIKKTTGKDELEHLSDDLIIKTEIESHETKEESHISPEKIPDFHEMKEEKLDENKFLTSLIDTSISKKEQLQVEDAKEKEESLLKEHEETAEEIAALKEKSDEEVKEVFKELSTDQLPKDSNLQIPTVSELDKASSVIISESAAVVEPQDIGEEPADVSVPIFSNFIDDTLDISEESDSSSDVSRKTTLSTRPYDTPRHRQKWQHQESIEIAGMSGVRTFKEERDASAETEQEEDTDSNLSLDEIEKTEDSIITEATCELKEDMEIAAIFEKISSDDERPSSVSLLKEGNDKDIIDKDFESKIEIEESDIKSEIKNLLTTIHDIVPLTLSIEKLNGMSKDNVNEIPVIKEHAESKSKIATPRKKIEKVSESVKQDDKNKIRLPSSKSEQIDPKESKIITENLEIDKTRIEDIVRDQIRSKESDISLTPEKYIAKTISSGRSMKKKKKPEGPKAPSPGERKRVLDKSEEKSVPSYSQRRSRKFTGDSEKQTRGGESQKRSPRREEEHHRKKQVIKSKFKTDKKSTISSKTGEIDTSKTQSKYMAWYNKNREEAEKKKLEKKTADDEEQLPRWVSRSLKQTAKQREKLTVERKTPEMTPRTRRKIKPLVNVESEQLKAIVRQGRQLRKAEGIPQEDPPIQIFARTPPASTSDTQHHLQQHSEYKYERIPPPFYLHPPPAPHPSPQLSPERSLEMQRYGSQYEQSEDNLHSENAAPFQSGGRLRHQQLLEKKSVFDIAYSEAAPSQLRSDSATPPS